MSSSGDGRGLWVLIGSGDRRGSWVLIGWVVGLVVVCGVVIDVGGTVVVGVAVGGEGVGSG